MPTTKSFFIVSSLFIFTLAACCPAWCSDQHPAPGLAKAISATAQKQVGVRYRRGGTSPKRGFDCSGFVRWVFGQYGIELLHKARLQRRAGRKVVKNRLKPADLVFFSRRPAKRARRASHVGIHVGGGWFMHAATGDRRVRLDHLQDPYWSKRFLAARRLVE